MSLVSSRLALKHRLTIERDANAGSDDGWNNPQAPNWQPHLIDLPCRAWTPTGREIVEEETTIAAVDHVYAIVPLGTDVTERDRVASVTTRGTTFQPGPLTIRAVLPREDHIELVLVKAK